MKINYMKKIKLILTGECLRRIGQEWIRNLENAGIVCEGMEEPDARMSKEGTLYITDREDVLLQLIKEEMPVLVYHHEGVWEQDFSVAGYVFEGQEAPDVEYLERVYRRFAKIPWDILETKRCLVRESVPEDVEAFGRIYREPSVTRYMDPFVKTAGGERRYIQDYIDKVYAYYEFGIWTVILKETNEVIGRAGISVSDGCELPQLGYVIGVDWQGKGLATEVCEAILEYADTVLEIGAIQACIHPENLPSLYLARHLGFHRKQTNDIVNDGYQIFVKDA